MNNNPGRRKLTITAHTMAKVADSFVSLLEDRGWEVCLRVPVGQRFSAPELAEVADGSEAMIIGDDEASEFFFQSVAPHLRLLVKWGVGTDAVDFQAAERFGVQVRNTPGAFSDEVADLALAFVLALARNIVSVHSGVVEGRWDQVPGTTLALRTLGIVGFGGIGQAVASRSIAFGMKVLFFDPYYSQVPPSECLSRSFSEVMANSDFLVLTCPSTPETRGIVNSNSLSLMKDGSSIVNVARGDLIVERDLVGSLKSGRLAGAALDVYETEPLPESSDLRKCPNVVLGAHNGSNTEQGLMRASLTATKIVISYGEDLDRG